MSDTFKISRRNKPSPKDLERGMSAPPSDQADMEIMESIAENRPIDPAKAFPEPAPTIEEQVAAGAGMPEQMAEVLGPDDATPADLTVVRKRSRVIPPPEEAPPPMPGPENTPTQRMQEVAKHSNQYLDEYRMKLLHRLLMRNLPLDTIAAQLGVPVYRVQAMRSELFKRLKYEAQTINRYEIAGRTLAFYDEVQGMALRMADSTGDSTKPYVRLQALQTALAAQADRQRFLTASGFWSAAPFTPMDAIEDDSSRAASKIQNLIEAIIDDKGEMQIDSLSLQDEDDQAGSKVDLL